MNCRQSQHLLSAERDASLPAGQRAALDAHLIGCEDCRRHGAELSEALDTLRAKHCRIEIPDAKAEWLLLSAKLGQPKTRAKEWRTPDLRWITTGGLGTALAALALIFFLNRHSSDQPPVTQVAQAPARAEYVELGDESASPVVYVDQQSGWLIVWAEGA